MQAGDAERIETVLGPLAVGRFDGAAMHTPTEVTVRALDILHRIRADCVVAISGRSTTGLAKALAARTGIDQVILPTTYAGSEVTPVLGETDQGVKTVSSAPAVLPETVIYDVELTLRLPLRPTVTSAFNAMAHAVEALHTPDTNPPIEHLALDASPDCGMRRPDIPARPRPGHRRPATGSRTGHRHALPQTPLP